MKLPTVSEETSLTMARKKTVALNDDSARNIAVNALLALERDGRYLQDTINEIFRRCNLPSRDRHLAEELARGSCRQLISLDYLTRQHSNRPRRQIDPVVLQILRIGLYQMVYLSRTPDFAAVSEAVEQAKQCEIRGCDSFVNAVLRSVQQHIKGPITSSDSPPPRAVLWLDENHACLFADDFLPDPARNVVKYLSAAFAHPPWLIEKWLKRHDRQTVTAICRADNTRPCLWLRLNRLRCRPEEFEARLQTDGIAFQRHGHAVRLLASADPAQLPCYDDGWFSVQDITAMSVAPLLEPRPGMHILDLCAAPGGKTTHLGELMDNTGTIAACDVNSEKLRRIEENCRRLGISIVQTVIPDQLEQHTQQTGLFDAVLVDAPCSNTGVLARRVEARHLLKPVVIQRLVQKQAELLQRAGRLVRPGGTIVYSTCSIEPTENKLQVEKFLRDNRSFHLAEEHLRLPVLGQADPTTGGPENPTHLHAPHDGGYVAVLTGGQ